MLSQRELSDDGWSYYFDSVVVFGRVSVLRKLGLKYYPSADEVEEEIRRDMKRALLLRFDIEHMSGKRVHEK